MLSASKIKQRAAELGFTACGLARANAVDNHTAAAFDTWINEGCNAEMIYMCQYRDLRLDPRQLHPGTQTVISFALPYRPSVIDKVINRAQLSWYALGPDYHEVMRTLLKSMSIEGRVCVDTAPILEKYWAVKCGLGWIGRNHQLVIPGMGSAFFLGEILSTEEADEYDEDKPNATQNSCGNCHRCEEACPTGALRKDGMLDARLCLSYLTIENKGDISIPAPDDGEKYIYGCDRCLKACPHLSGAPCQAHFPVNPDLLAMTDEDWKNLTTEQYQRLFKGSAVKRAKLSGLQRNIQWAKL